MTPEEKAERLAAWNAAHPYFNPHNDRPANEVAGKLVQAVMEGRSQAKAYQELHPGATPKSCAEAASRILANPRTIAMLTEAQKARAQAIGLDTTWLIHEFLANYIQAHDEGDRKGALRCLENIKDALPGFDANKPHSVNIINSEKGHVQVNMVEVRLTDANRDH